MTTDQGQEAPQEPADPKDPTAILKRVGNATEEQLQQIVSEYIHELKDIFKMDEYEIILLFDEEDEISTWHSDRIYSAANKISNKKILLLIHSLGGRIEPAYLISKVCKRLAKEHFAVAVPRKAKSAATLICLGADGIHMGFMSELGPIDPQFGGLPALGMQNALHVLADLSCKYPASAEMLSKFLTEKLDLRMLGYFERVTESAVQYAERLLAQKNPLSNTQENKKLADHFVNHYKDHGFVIDIDEALKYLGSDLIKCNTTEYQFANAVHETLEFLMFFTRRRFKKKFDYVGSVEQGLRLYAIK